MKSIWLVVADNGGHNAGWPVRAFGTEAEAVQWAKAEAARVGKGQRPDVWVDGTSLSVEEVPFGL